MIISNKESNGANVCEQRLVLEWSEGEVVERGSGAAPPASHMLWPGASSILGGSLKVAQNGSHDTLGSPWLGHAIGSWHTGVTTIRPCHWIMQREAKRWPSPIENSMLLVQESGEKNITNTFLLCPLCLLQHSILMSRFYHHLSFEQCNIGEYVPNYGAKQLRDMRCYTVRSVRACLHWLN